MTALEELHQKIIAEIQAGESRLPPVDNWNPSLSGDMDLCITREGKWIHEGEPIRREALVRVFSSILKREGDEYFLVTPVEKWRIRVEDAPFTVVGLDLVKEEKVQVLVFTTSVGDKVAASPQNPLRVAFNSKGEPSPYLAVRGNMEGLLSRPVFYQLAELAESGPGGSRAVRGVYSLGAFFPLEQDHMLG